MTVNNSEENQNSRLYTSTKSDENTILVTNNGKLSLKDSLLNKRGDTQSSGDDADFYGINSILLVNEGAKASIKDVELVSNSKGSNGIFVCGNSNEGGEMEGGMP